MVGKGWRGGYRVGGGIADLLVLSHCKRNTTAYDPTDRVRMSFGKPSNKRMSWSSRHILSKLPESALKLKKQPVAEIAETPTSSTRRSSTTSTRSSMCEPSEYRRSSRGTQRQIAPYTTSGSISGSKSGSKSDASMPPVPSRSIQASTLVFYGMDSASRSHSSILGVPLPKPTQTTGAPSVPPLTAPAVPTHTTQPVPVTASDTASTTTATTNRTIPAPPSHAAPPPPSNQPSMQILSAPPVPPHLPSAHSTRTPVSEKEFMAQSKELYDRFEENDDDQRNTATEVVQPPKRMSSLEYSKRRQSVFISLPRDGEGMPFLTLDLGEHKQMNFPEQFLSNTNTNLNTNLHGNSVHNATSLNSVGTQSTQSMHSAPSMLSSHSGHSGHSAANSTLHYDADPTESSINTIGSDLTMDTTADMSQVSSYKPQHVVQAPDYTREFSEKIVGANRKIIESRGVYIFDPAESDVQLPRLNSRELFNPFVR